MRKPQFIVDDWGMSPSINEAALYLAQRGYLYGVSIIPHSRFYDHRLKELLKTHVKIGCHANFTFNTAPESPEQSSWMLVSGKILRSVFTGLVAPKKLEAALSEQVSWVKTHVGRLDYLDGHHHIHLYPGIFQASKRVCARSKIPYRVVSDETFRSNFLLGWLAKQTASPKTYFECLYLRDADLKDEALLNSKLCSGLPIAIHPALQDDFESLQVGDSLSAERVTQFQTLIQFLEKLEVTL